MNQDEQNLKLLSIFHYVLGALSIVSCTIFGLIYIFLGVMMRNIPPGAKDAPPPGVEWVIISVGVLALVAGVVIGCLQIAVGVKLVKHQSRVFCIVIAAIECLNMPLGTILGVFTIIVLVKPSVIALFEGRVPPAAATPPV